MDTDPLPDSPALLLISLAAKPAIEFHAPDTISWFAWGVIIALACFCLLISGFVSGSEIAYFSLSQSQIDDLEDDKRSEAQTAFRLLTNSERLLATILITNNLVNISMVVLLTFGINQVISFNSWLLNFLVQTVFLTFLLLLLGEIFPKLVARGRTLKWVILSSRGIDALYRIFGGPAKLMARSTAVMNRIVTKKEKDISTDDLEKALEISDISEETDKEMLEGILTFGEKEVNDIMTSRVDVTALEYRSTWSEAMKVVVDSGFSRIPVYDTSLDTVRGVLYAKDLLPYIGKRDDSFRWQTLIRQAFYVPEGMRIDDLLEDFRLKRIHIAVVVDEYGGTCGIVTLEDIIEEIVGEIDDEYDDKACLYRRITDDTYIFEAKISLSDFCRALDIEESQLGDTDQVETLAGLVLELKGDFPEPGEVVECGNLKLRVLKMERHRILRVKVSIDRTAEKPADDNAD